MIAPLLPGMAANLRVSVSAVGQLVTVFALTYAVSSPILTALTGSFDRRKLLILTMTAFALANIVAWAAKNYPAALRGRRATLRRLTACLLAGAASWIPDGHGKNKKDFICANLSALSQAESRQRKLDNYTEKSLDPSKTCSGCRFFTTGAEPTACGKCEIFNGPANPKGRCDDWAARPA